MISLQDVRRFLGKTPEQRKLTARFVAARWLAKVPYAPVRFHLSISPQERINYWWSCFPGNVDPDGVGLFGYQGADLRYLRFIWRFLRPEMTFFDVGAYHGIYALIAAKKLGEAGRVVAFEPSPVTVQRLKLNLRLNRVSSATVENCAVAANEGTASLFSVREGQPDMNTLCHAVTDHALSKTKVETITLDGYLQRQLVDRVDLIKIDTEGAEMEVFRGASRLLKGLRPLVICEVLDEVTRPWGYEAREIINTLQACDYDWFDIHLDGRLSPHCPRKEYPEIKNYLAVPREKLSNPWLSLNSSN